MLPVQGSGSLCSIFKQDFEGAHDALNDVMATAKCFFELQKNNLIQLPQ